MHTTTAVTAIRSAASANTEKYKEALAASLLDKMIEMGDSINDIPWFSYGARRAVEDVKEAA